MGALSGYQGIYEKYGRDSGASVTTLPGLVYLFTRGLVPASAFGLLYYTRTIQNALPVEALGLGAGTEVFLRSKMYVKGVPKGRTRQDILKGPLDVIHWYQNLFLESISERLGIIRQERVTKHLRRMPNETTFFSVCEKVRANADALGQDKADKALRGDVATLRSEYVGRVLPQSKTSEPTTITASFDSTS